MVGRAYQEVRALADLPGVIRSGLGVDRPGRDGVADRGRPFNVTDIVDDNLERRRASHLANPRLRRHLEPSATPDRLPICWLFRFGLEVAEAQGNRLEP
jgi:hypothetical protein